MEKLELKGATPGEVEMLAMRGIAQARSDLQGPAAATAKILANIKEDRFAQAWSTVINELFLKTDGNAPQVIDSITFAVGWPDIEPDTSTRNTISRGGLFFSRSSSCGWIMRRK